MPVVFQVAAYLALPALVLAAERRVRLVRLVGSVLVCYALGLGLAHLPGWTPDPHLANTASVVAVALAIPLLLFSLDVVRWARLAGRTTLSFGLCVVSVAAAGSVAALLFRDRVPGYADVVGMLAGVYTGGTPNLAAIGVALGVPPETFVTLNAADIVVSTVYLPFLLAVAPRLYARWLPPFAPAGASEALDPVEGRPASLAHRAAAVLLAALIVAAGGGVASVLPLGEFQTAAAILAVSTVAVACSLVRRVRTWPGTYSTGNYWLLVFCVAIGSAADFEALWTGGAAVVAMTALVLFGASALHLGLAVLFRVDRDTLIVTNTASIFGPAFVGPVAAALGNREVILSGIATGLVGYAIGNYLGLAMAWVLGPG